ncbi:unnamed protein product [Trichogramma brassicae]|uniref:Uncharacterized protein n=3 Tax=Trichogramma brassicae TaxID=86971 RepID=A0A6H5ITC5_9HYME|nr:unnamed protein product [Trichogramma brassicae]
MEKLRFEFVMKAAADKKSNALMVTSITTPDGEIFDIPAELQEVSLHTELMKTDIYKKIKNTNLKRNQKRNVWILLNAELKAANTILFVFVSPYTTLVLYIYKVAGDLSLSAVRSARNYFVYCLRARELRRRGEEEELLERVGGGGGRERRDSARERKREKCGAPAFRVGRLAAAAAAAAASGVQRRAVRFYEKCDHPRDHTIIGSGLARDQWCVTSIAQAARHTHTHTATSSSSSSCTTARPPRLLLLSLVRVHDQCQRHQRRRVTGRRSACRRVSVSWWWWCRVLPRPIESSCQLAAAAAAAAHQQEVRRGWSGARAVAALCVRMQHEPRCPALLGADEPRLQGDCCTTLPWTGRETSAAAAAAAGCTADHSDDDFYVAAAAATAATAATVQHPRRLRRRRSSADRCGSDSSCTTIGGCSGGAERRGTGSPAATSPADTGDDTTTLGRWPTSTPASGNNSHMCGGVPLGIEEAAAQVTASTVSATSAAAGELQGRSFRGTSKSPADPDLRARLRRHQERGGGGGGGAAGRHLLLLLLLSPNRPGTLTPSGALHLHSTTTRIIVRSRRRQKKRKKKKKCASASESKRGEVQQRCHRVSTATARHPQLVVDAQQAAAQQVGLVASPRLGTDAARLRQWRRPPNTRRRSSSTDSSSSSSSSGGSSGIDDDDRAVDHSTITIAGQKKKRRRRSRTRRPQRAPIQRSNTALGKTTFTATLHRKSRPRRLLVLYSLLLLFLQSFVTFAAASSSQSMLKQQSRRTVPRHPYNEYAWELNQINPWLSACDLSGPAPDLQGSCGPPEVPKSCPGSCRQAANFDRVVELLQAIENATNTMIHTGSARRKSHHHHHDDDEDDDEESEDVVEEDAEAAANGASREHRSKSSKSKSSSGPGDGGAAAAAAAASAASAPDQCLFYLEESHKRDVCRQDFGTSASRSYANARENRYWYLKGLRLRHCCEQSAVHALAPGKLGPLEAVLEGGPGCSEALDKLLAVDQMAARLHCEFEEVLARYDCGQVYSVQHNCNHCKRRRRPLYICAVYAPAELLHSDRKHPGDQQKHQQQNRGGGGGGGSSSRRRKERSCSRVQSSSEWRLDYSLYFARITFSSLSQLSILEKEQFIHLKCNELRTHRKSSFPGLHTRIRVYIHTDRLFIHTKAALEKSFARDRHTHSHMVYNLRSLLLPLLHYYIARRSGGKSGVHTVYRSYSADERERQGVNECIACRHRVNNGATGVLQAQVALDVECSSAHPPGRIIIRGYKREKDSNSNSGSYRDDKVNVLSRDDHDCGGRRERERTVVRGYMERDERKRRYSVGLLRYTYEKKKRRAKKCAEASARDNTTGYLSSSVRKKKREKKSKLERSAHRLHKCVPPLLPAKSMPSIPATYNILARTYAYNTKGIDSSSSLVHSSKGEDKLPRMAAVAAVSGMIGFACFGRSLYRSSTYSSLFGSTPIPT